MARTWKDSASKNGGKGRRDRGDNRERRWTSDSQSTYTRKPKHKTPRSEQSGQHLLHESDLE